MSKNFDPKQFEPKNGNFQALTEDLVQRSAAQADIAKTKAKARAQAKSEAPPPADFTPHATFGGSPTITPNTLPPDMLGAQPSLCKRIMLGLFLIGFCLFVMAVFIGFAFLKEFTANYLYYEVFRDMLQGTTATLIFAGVVLLIFALPLLISLIALKRHEKRQAANQRSQR